jgi:Transposase DDE domain
VVGCAERPGLHAARASLTQRSMSSGWKRNGPSSPPILTDGMRPCFAASYSHVRETRNRAATSAGLSRSIPDGPSPFIWVLNLKALMRPTTCLQARALCSPQQRERPPVGGCRGVSSRPPPCRGGWAGAAKGSDEYGNGMRTGESLLSREAGISVHARLFPESRVMKSADDAFHPSYSGQPVIDGTTQVMVAAELSDQTPDAEQLEPALDQLKENLEATGTELPEGAALSADAGYFSEENVNRTAAHGLDRHIATGRFKRRFASARRPARRSPCARCRRRDLRLVFSLRAGCCLAVAFFPTGIQSHRRPLPEVGARPDRAPSTQHHRDSPAPRSNIPPPAR